MSGKYLPLKFALVVVMVILSIGSLFYGKGLKEGLDIAGGYSMLFEVYNDQNDPTLVERVIAVLKKRIDPTGLNCLEWTPMKNNRFQVRMPAASEKSQELRRKYINTRDTLLAKNIHQSEIRKLSVLTGQARSAAVAKLTGPNVAQAKRVEALVGAMDKLAAAEANLKAVRTINAKHKSMKPEVLQAEQKALQEAQDAVAVAAAEYRKQFEAVRDGNISPARLLGILKLYDDARLQENKAEKAAAMSTFESRLESFRKTYAVWDEQIANVVDLYKEWTQIRRPLEDPSDLKRMIRKAGVLNFRIAPLNPQHGEDKSLSEEKIRQYAKDLDADGPEATRDIGKDYAWYPIYGDEQFDRLVVRDYAGRRYVLLSNKPGQRMIQSRDDETKWSLSGADVGSDNYGAPAIDFRFDAAGAKIFASLTGNNLKKPMAILLDDEVYSAPNIQSTIIDRGQITGRFTLEEVKDLVRILEAGSLPAKVNPEPVSESVFGAAIGEVNLQKGIRAAIIGLIAVAAFMMFYYLLCGAIADVALLLNMILVLGAMSMFDAVLTLPGIAGVILTIGMAVDANVLIFERLREEQAKGLPIHQAIKNAYERAFSAIIDANITTLLICLFLFVVFDWVGMEAVRGFAITLGLGVIFSMFTSLLVTRWIFQTFMSLGLLKKSLPMLRLIPKVNINWMGKRYIFWAISAVLIVLGVGSMAWQGRDILGIEFSSGTEAMIKFADDALIEDKLPEDGLVRTAIEKKIDGYKEKLQNKLAAETPRIAEEKSKLTTDLDKLNEELGTHKARLTKAQTDKADDETLSTINRKVNSLESGQASLKKKIETLDKTIATLRADIRGCTRFKETVRAETVINENNVRDFLKLYGNDKDEVTLASWKAKGKNVEFFDLLDVNPKDGILSVAELDNDKLPQMSYQISTTETNARLIRGIINEVFGKALQRRLPCRFDLVKGETIKRLGLTLARDGRTFITGQLCEDVSTGFRDDLLDFQNDGGLMFVVNNVTPSISISDFNGRIRDIRLQPDFGRQAVNPYKVMGLTPDGDEYSAFVVLVRPANPEEAKNKKARVVFADGELSVLTEALGRSDAMVATNFDPQFAAETGQLAIVVIALSWLAIVGYLWLRFGSIQWGLAAVICLVHDVIIVIGMVAVTGWLVDSSVARALGIGSFKIDLAMVAAILTVIGYSVNDTIVVFDRIRENRGKLKTVTINCINTSINQTLPRTLLTSFTTFIVVFIMYVWGGPGIKSFSFALLVGIIFGTYSSVAVASPLLLGFKHALVAKVTKEDTEG